MLDINQYTYTNDPFDYHKNFSVHPLDDKGTETYYYDKESHAKIYIDKLNPRFLRKIHEERNDFRRTQIEELQNEEVAVKEKVFDSTELRENFNPKVNENEVISTKPCFNKTFNIPSKPKKQTKKLLIKSQSQAKLLPLDEKIAVFGSSNFGKKINRNLSYSIEPKSERFNIALSDINNNDKGFNIRPIKKIGFESFNVPRVNSYNKKLLKSIKFNDFNKKCMNSVSGGFFNKEENCLDSLITQENKRLKDIFMSQTSNGFLKHNNLPKISYIVNQPQIVIKTTGIGNSKYMGLKYNPHNFTANSHKNMTKRNINGALFLH